MCKISLVRPNIVLKAAFDPHIVPYLILFSDLGNGLRTHRFETLNSNVCVVYVVCKCVLCFTVTERNMSHTIQTYR